MAINELTVTVEVRRRGFIGTLLKTPKVFRQHYRTMRRNGNGRVLSAYGAWLMSGLVVGFK